MPEHTFVWPREKVELALELVAGGHPDSTVAAVTGVPRRTVSDWRRFPERALRRDALPCGNHDFCCLPARDYCYLLGLYLGDGCISRSGNTWRLRVTLDAAHPRILLACGLAMEMVLRGKRANWCPRPNANCVDVSMWYSHWPCLFPQHGPGKKHERQIELATWQKDLVAREPESLLCGLIHSDGCRIVARYRERKGPKLRPRYVFSNRSPDIKDIFCSACDAIGVEWSRPSSRDVAIARAKSVAKLDSFLGPKR